MVFLLHVGRLPLPISRIVSRNWVLCEAAFRRSPVQCDKQWSLSAIMSTFACELRVWWDRRKMSCSKLQWSERKEVRSSPNPQQECIRRAHDCKADIDRSSVWNIVSMFDDRCLRKFFRCLKFHHDSNCDAYCGIVINNEVTKPVVVCLWLLLSRCNVQFVNCTDFPGEWRKNPLGGTYWYEYKEHLIPKELQEVQRGDRPVEMAYFQPKLEEWHLYVTCLMCLAWCLCFIVPRVTPGNCQPQVSQTIGH